MMWWPAGRNNAECSFQSPNHSKSLLMEAAVTSTERSGTLADFGRGTKPHADVGELSQARWVRRTLRAPAEADRKQLMEVQHGNELASHSGPESCGGAREGAAEGLTGETCGPAIERRNPEFGTPPQALHTPGSFLHGSWEISAVPDGTAPGSVGKAKSRTPTPPTVEKSGALIVPRKPSNKGVQPTEMVEGRSAAKGNAEQVPASRTQSRTSCASMGLEGVRRARAGIAGA